MHRDQNMHYWDWLQFQKIQSLKRLSKREIEKSDISKEMAIKTLSTFFVELQPQTQVYPTLSEKRPIQRLPVGYRGLVPYGTPC